MVKTATLELDWLEIRTMTNAMIVYAGCIPGIVENGDMSNETALMEISSLRELNDKLLACQKVINAKTFN